MKWHIWSALVVCLFVAWPKFAPAQSIFDQIGLTALRDRLGGSAPTGAGIQVMHAEALVSSPPPAYLPNPGDSEFSGKSFTDHSGGGAVSGHATTVGRFFYGTTNGVAPGITQIHNYRVDGSVDSGDWFGAAYLNFGGGLPVATPNFRVQNHSWIGIGAFDAAILMASRRYDFALHQDNVIGVVGVNNGAGQVIPALLANTYNSIAVGLTNGNSSYGPSTGDVPGRSKPDIVAPHSATSFATPLVAGSAALLLNTADAKVDPTERANAGRMETVKAALLAGATKDEFAALPQPWTRFSNGSYLEPLDRRFGAGELNINNSHLILSSPQQHGADALPDALTGWDYVTVSAAGQNRQYIFDLPPIDGTYALSAAITWNRIVNPDQTGPDLFDNTTVQLPHFTLSLLHNGSPIDVSASPIDNVQYLYITGLQAGQQYVLEVNPTDLNGLGAARVAVAWITAVPEPGTVSLCLVSTAGLLAARRLRARRGGR
jgi:hypothetical protein